MNANNFGAAILIAKVSKGQILYSRILRKRIKPNKTCEGNLRFYFIE